MVNGPTTPIPVKAKPSSTDPVLPPVTMGKSIKSNSTNDSAKFFLCYTHANPVTTLQVAL